MFNREYKAAQGFRFHSAVTSSLHDSQLNSREPDRLHYGEHQLSNRKTSNRYKIQVVLCHFLI